MKKHLNTTLIVIGSLGIVYAMYQRHEQLNVATTGSDLDTGAKTYGTIALVGGGVLIAVGLYRHFKK